MDIPELSMAMAQNEVMNQVNIALMGKTMDQMEQNGAVLAEQMTSTPSGVMTAEHIDLLV